MRTLNLINLQEKMFFDLVKHVPDYVKTLLPYNIKQDESGNTVLEMAVAGYSQEDLSVEYTDGNLTIKGKGQKEEDSYVYKGLTTKDFETSFPVNPIYNIDEVGLKNGLLLIKLKRSEKEINKYDIKLLA
jgi:molecular chaperone IbpA